MGLWPAPDSKTIPKFPNFGHDWALSIGNFVLLIISGIRSYLEKKLAAQMACARFQGQFNFFLCINNYRTFTCNKCSAALQIHS
jgi:hypothetical protein